jgi:tRNA-2-methylthio-N6-dimethylallyladenosine synthase
VSRPSADILEEARKLIDNGYKSITLLGQNVNSYGLDKKGEELSFAALLDQLGEMADASAQEVWIYFTSPVEPSRDEKRGATTKCSFV